jgi:hypothetical protein
MAEAGITQFIDIGCGLPTMENTHQVVHRITPGARIVYVDYDPVVIVHAKALLVKGDDNVAAIRGDLRDPAGILDALREVGLLDLGNPCGLLISAVLHFIPDADDPVGAVRRLTGGLARGSYLALSHVTIDGVSADRVEMGLKVYRCANAQMNPRNKAEVTSFFDGMEFLPPWPGAEPGVSRVSLWGRGEPPDPGEAASESWWAAVARKP